ncbi:response regulator [Chitinimonas arctica]|uniref:Response regulator n=1 Tax=Chitinimonas arctica TaxID=2594795 RepID=A0A516SD30_9NEIS|nr:response regulator [Chitinimonas arctica]QDQ26062.1 response regulator [Chitinimonas arctica]
MAQSGKPVSTLLLVDDEPFNLEILSEHLTEAGYAIETALNGEEAWSILTQAGDSFDAVLLDRMMPGLNGMEVLKRMQAHPQLSELPVVMQTAVGSPDAVREGMEAGAYYYLTKPFERDMLLAIVAAAVAQHRARRAVKQVAAQPLDGLALLDEARFSLATLDEAQRVATLLGRMTPAPERAVLGLTELMVNAIEHGNLGVGYGEKKAMMQSGHWRETIEAMQREPEHCDKRVRIVTKREGDMLLVEISDEGDGFEWEPYLDFDPARAFDPNGRGISMARAMSFEALDYRGTGNVVVASIRLSSSTSNQ